MRLEVGNICFLLNLENTKIARELRTTRYADFLSRKDPDFTIEFCVQPKINLDEYPEIMIKSEEGIHYVFRWDFTAQIKVDQGRAKAILKYEAPSTADAVVRICYSLLSIKFGGFLLHAATVVKGKNGYIFTGKTESGKTTIARLSSNYKVLTDEISMIRKVNGHYRTFGTPFWGQGGQGRNENFKVRRILFLRKDNKNFVKMIKKKEALRAILGNLLFFATEWRLTNDVFVLSNEIVDSIPCYELHFLPTKDFWRCIENEVI